MTSHFENDDDDQPADPWPAFADLFSASSLLFITFVATFIYVAVAREGETSTTRRAIVERLVEASRNGQLFSVDSTDPQFVRIVLLERATFPAGSFRWETLRTQGREALTRIGVVLNDSTLRGEYREVRVLGHTDQVPYTSAGFTNWELSAARAAVVARFLVNSVNVDPCKISATGLASYYPVAPDDLEANRRIEIQILPRLVNRAGEPDGTCMPAGDGTRAVGGGAVAAPATATTVGR